MSPTLATFSVTPASTDERPAPRMRWRTDDEFASLLAAALIVPQAVSALPPVPALPAAGSPTVQVAEPALGAEGERGLDGALGGQAAGENRGATPRRVPASTPPRAPASTPPVTARLVQLLGTQLLEDARAAVPNVGGRETPSAAVPRPSAPAYSGGPDQGLEPSGPPLRSAAAAPAASMTLPGDHALATAPATRLVIGATHPAPEDRRVSGEPTRTGDGIGGAATPRDGLPAAAASAPRRNGDARPTPHIAGHSRLEAPAATRAPEIEARSREAMALDPAAQLPLPHSAQALEVEPATHEPGTLPPRGAAPGQQPAHRDPPDQLGGLRPVSADAGAPVVSPVATRSDGRERQKQPREANDPRGAAASADRGVAAASQAPGTASPHEGPSDAASARIPTVDAARHDTVAGNPPPVATDRIAFDIPDERGATVRVRVEVRGETVNARIVHPDAQVTRDLRQGLDELRGALEQRGFTDARLSVKAPAAIAEPAAPPPFVPLANAGDARSVRPAAAASDPSPANQDRGSDAAKDHQGHDGSRPQPRSKRERER
jgi:hypothetical protein